MCFNDVRNRIYYKCIHSDVSYKANYAEYHHHFTSVSKKCHNDSHFYQACGFNTKITNTDVLCGGYIHTQKIGGKHKYTEKSHIPEYKYGVICRDWLGLETRVPVLYRYVTEMRTVILEKTNKTVEKLTVQFTRVLTTGGKWGIAR